MSAETALARSRIFAAKLFVDTCTVQRLLTAVTDPDTALTVNTYTTIYTGPCKIQQASGYARPKDVGQAQVFETRMQLHLPVTAPVPQPDDLLTITACPHDPDEVGRTWHIRGTPDKTWASAHRVGIEEVTG